MIRTHREPGDPEWTADHPGGCADDITEMLRSQLAEYMPPHQSWCHAEAHGDCCDGDCDCGVEASLDVLVPAVIAYGERAVANALAARVLRDIDYAAERES